MRIPLLAAALAFTVAPPAFAQAPAAAPAMDPRLRETAGCAAVFITMSQLAANPQVTGADPMAGALASAFGRSWAVKGRGLYAQAAEEARRTRLPAEAAFEAGVGYLVDAFAAARARAPGGNVDFTTEAAGLVQRCVTVFPDQVPSF
jgi:hypothetical protein